MNPEDKTSQNKTNKDIEKQKELEQDRKLRAAKHEAEVAKFQVNLIKELIRRVNNSEFIILLFMYLTISELHIQYINKYNDIKNTYHNLEIIDK